MDEQNRNLILAMALSFLVIFVWTVFFAPIPEPLPTEAEIAADGTAPPSPEEETTPADATTAWLADLSPEDQEAAALRADIKTDRVAGSISARGGRIDDLRLLDYRVTLEDEERVTLLSPTDSETPYYVLHGWTASSATPTPTPGANTIWTFESDAPLSPETPVTLSWDNGEGLLFRREVSIDANYMFQITQTVENTTDTAVRLAPYGIIAREGEPRTEGIWVVHEGVIQSVDGEIGETNYGDMVDFETLEGNARVATYDVTQNGWIGFTSKYWMTTLIPSPGTAFTAAAKYTPGADTYQTDMRLPVIEIAPGATGEIATNLFAGAKEYETIGNYERDMGISQFIDSIDWGWFFFLTKPLFWVLHELNLLIGNMGWAIIGLTVVIKTLLLPLAYKSYVSMAKMKELQPEMEKIKERAGDDRQKLQEEVMALYKKEKVNPASGCLPILVQIPIFFSLYKVIFVTLELRHAPFIGWIQDLSAKDPTSFMNLFGLLPYEIPAFLGLLSIGVWPILMGVTMWLQQKLNPAPTDPTQAAVFAWMPWIFMFMLGTFASGLVIYWVANNTLTFIQQYAIMRSQGMTPDVFGNIREGFKKLREPAEKPPEEKK